MAPLAILLPCQAVELPVQEKAQEEKSSEVGSSWEGCFMPGFSLRAKVKDVKVDRFQRSVDFWSIASTTEESGPDAEQSLSSEERFLETLQTMQAL